MSRPEERLLFIIRPQKMPAVRAALNTSDLEKEEVSGTAYEYVVGSANPAVEEAIVEMVASYRPYKWQDKKSRDVWSVPVMLAFFYGQLKRAQNPWEHLSLLPRVELGDWSKEALDGDGSYLLNSGPYKSVLLVDYDPAVVAQDVEDWNLDASIEEDEQ